MFAALLTTITPTMNTIERTEDGQDLNGSGVVAADAVVLLSGVNYGSVVRVLAALNAIGEYEASEDIGQGAPAWLAADLINWESVPTTPTRPSDDATEARHAAALAYVREVVKTGHAARFSDVLLKLPQFR